MLAALEVLGFTRADIRPLEISNKDPLEVHPVADAAMQEEFKPCPNMFPHADGEVLNDEAVIIHSSSSAGEPEVFEPYTGFVSPVYLVMLVGSQKRCGNDALWMRRPKARGPRPFRLGLRSLGWQPHLGCVSSVPSMV